MDDRQNRSCDEIPVVITLKRNHRLNVGGDFRSLVRQTDVVVETHLNRYGYQVGNWID